MTKNNTKKASSKKKFQFKLNATNIILILGAMLVLIPAVVIGSILISSSLQTGSVIKGSRFNNDLDPAITKEHMDRVKTEIEQISGVTVESINLKAATLRLIVITEADTEEKQVAVSESVINALDTVLDIDTYFTDTETKKMYDLEINIVDQLDVTKTFHVIVTKNAEMDEYHVDDVLSPKNPTLAAELLQKLNEKNNPQPEIPSGSGEGESESDSESSGE